MLWITLALLGLGLLLVYLEFFLPGGITGAVGGIVLLGSVFCFYAEFRSLGWSGIYFAFVIGLVVGTCFYALHRVRNSETVYLKGDQKGFLATTFDKKLVGKEGVAVSPLRLSGHIEVDGVEYQAMAQSRFIEKGKTVKIIGGRGGHLIVREV